MQKTLRCLVVLLAMADAASASSPLQNDGHHHHLLKTTSRDARCEMPAGASSRECATTPEEQPRRVRTF